ncbi:hypothetical protein ORD22_08180 [Sporosarcina sp. GW1-11]|uniref:S24 family peptidase n=1 Tax=Sporosarcina sp. GW1-11 TaxID=2899126 RepID=UPI00294DB584|nr:S24 family peptidase [Sporosarcina sp. GW1-11]MDV6378224.1 hypothetical protein [Sporosarcina sp. GW1-11]
MKNRIIIPYFTKLVGHYYTTPENLIGKESLRMNQQLSQLYKTTDLFFLQASDDGMSLSGIKEYDKLLISIQNDFKPTDIVVLTFDDQPAIIRYVQEEDNHYIVKSTNPNYPTTILSKESVQIFGIVLKVWPEISFI